MRLTRKNLLYEQTKHSAEALVITGSGAVMLNAMTAHAVAGCEIH